MKIVAKAIIVVMLMASAFLLYAGYFEGDFLVKVPATMQPTSGRAHVAAVYFTGDVGYNVGMGRMIGNRLAADGIPVVAVNSLAFFRTHRTVSEVTEVTAKAIRDALAFGHADQVVLIGHSLGADALQASLEYLPQDLRSKVRAVALIVPTKELFLQISPGEMLDFGRPDSQVLPTLQKLTWVPVTCIYGTEELQSPCPLLISTNVRKAALPGGHAMHWDLDRIHSTLMEAIDAAARLKVTENSGVEHLTAMPGAAKA